MKKSAKPSRDLREIVGVQFHKWIHHQNMVFSLEEIFDVIEGEIKMLKNYYKIEEEER